MLQGVQASFQNPFWMFNVSMFPFQTSVIKAIKFLRSFAAKVIEERCLALKNGEETPKDLLEHILNEARENHDLDMDDLVDNFLTIFVAGTAITVIIIQYSTYGSYFIIFVRSVFSVIGGRLIIRDGVLISNNKVCYKISEVIYI